MLLLKLLKDITFNMKKFIVLLLYLVVFNAKSQNDLMLKYNLMPWPNEISENNFKFLINSDVTISIIGEDQGRVRNAAINFLRRLTDRTGVFLNEGFPVKNGKGTIVISFETISQPRISVAEIMNTSMINQ